MDAHKGFAGRDKVVFDCSPGKLIDGPRWQTPEKKWLFGVALRLLERARRVQIPPEAAQGITGCVRSLTVMLIMTREPRSFVPSPLAFAVASFKTHSLFSFARSLECFFLGIDVLGEEERIAPRQSIEAVSAVVVEGLSHGRWTPPHEDRAD
jgi:hypothetical protein